MEPAASLGPTTPAAIAARWIHYFNAHDVTNLVRLYADEGRHTSPRVRGLYPESDGDLVGRPALAQWWNASLRQTPGLQYETLAIVGDDSKAFVEYIRRAPSEPDTVVVERFDVRNGEIVSSRVFL
jgi:SnoaL-like domain